MNEMTIQPITHGNTNLKYVNFDSLNLMESKKCTENGCQQSEFRIVCSEFPSTIKNLKNYLEDKLDYLKLQTVTHLKSHFRIPCFNCSSSFHGSKFEDGHFNLQKLFEIGQKCVSCQRNFTTERSFYHNCYICNASFENCQLLAIHRRSEHNSAEPHQCAACYKSLCKGGVSNHIYSHTFPHICPYCNKRFCRLGSLKFHILSHTGETPLSCNYYTKKIVTKQSLDIHQFNCDLCHKTFDNRSLLKKHKSLHMEKSFQCKYCPRQYKTQYGLFYHLLKHNDDKKFKCDLCDKTFAKEIKLDQHKRKIHLKEFKCKYCPKQSRQRTRQCIYRHLPEHTDGKQFKNDLCDKVFATRLSLKQHEVVHKERSFQCSVCSKSFKKSFDLKCHTRNKHNSLGLPTPL